MKVAKQHEPLPVIPLKSTLSLFDKKSNILQNIINSRLETINSKLLFKDSYLKRKCIILANGYYEWQNKNGIKIPYLFQIIY